MSKGTIPNFRSELNNRLTTLSSTGVFTNSGSDNSKLMLSHRPSMDGSKKSKVKGEKCLRKKEESVRLAGRAQVVSLWFGISGYLFCFIIFGLVFAKCIYLYENKIPSVDDITVNLQVRLEKESNFSNSELVERFAENLSSIFVNAQFDQNITAEDVTNLTTVALGQLSSEFPVDSAVSQLTVAARVAAISSQGNDTKALETVTEVVVGVVGNVDEFVYLIDSAMAELASFTTDREEAAAVLPGALGSAFFNALNMSAIDIVEQVSAAFLDQSRSMALDEIFLLSWSSFLAGWIVILLIAVLVFIYRNEPEIRSRHKYFTTHFLIGALTISPVVAVWAVVLEFSFYSYRLGSQIYTTLIFVDSWQAARIVGLWGITYILGYGYTAYRNSKMLSAIWISWQLVILTVGAVIDYFLLLLLKVISRTHGYRFIDEVNLAGNANPMINMNNISFILRDSETRELFCRFTDGRHCTEMPRFLYIMQEIEEQFANTAVDYEVRVEQVDKGVRLLLQEFVVPRVLNISSPQQTELENNLKSLYSIDVADAQSNLNVNSSLLSTGMRIDFPSEDPPPNTDWETVINWFAPTVVHIKNLVRMNLLPVFRQSPELLQLLENRHAQEAVLARVGLINTALGSADDRERNNSDVNNDSGGQNVKATQNLYRRLGGSWRSKKKVAGECASNTPIDLKGCGVYDTAVESVAVIESTTPDSSNHSHSKSKDCLDERTNEIRSESIPQLGSTSDIDRLVMQMEEGKCDPHPEVPQEDPPTMYTTFVNNDDQYSL
eukprot:CFRG5727T1